MTLKIKYFSSFVDILPNFKNSIEKQGFSYPKTHSCPLATPHGHGPFTGSKSPGSWSVAFSPPPSPPPPFSLLLSLFPECLRCWPILKQGWQQIFSWVLRLTQLRFAYQSNTSLVCWGSSTSSYPAFFTLSVFFITSYKFRKAAAVEAQCALHAVVGKIFREMPGSSGIGALSVYREYIETNCIRFCCYQNKFISNML